MQLDQDTIVAIATPPGRGGIGIVRLSGPAARAIAETLLRLHHPLAHAKARFGYVVDPDGTVIDEAIVTTFSAPHSYTSEDVVEISTHGAPVLLEEVLRAAIVHGARLAEPGEFTQRAFLSGRLDLTQAEAVHDLITAQTQHQARTAAAQLGGSIARTLAPMKQDLIRLIAALEAGVDFAEDDLDLLPESLILDRIASLQSALSSLARTYRYGRILREGARLAIIGRPNAGKSSLFNRLLERERAIVTAQPGTTRDPIAERLSLNGIPIELVDTAGLREIPIAPETEAEREGIARTRSAMAEADLIVHVVDGSTLPADCDLHAEDQATQRVLSGRASLLVLNKCDIASVESLTRNALRTSARTGEGVEALKLAMIAALGAQPQGESALITNLRQSQALEAALTSLKQAHRAATSSTPHEFLLLDLHAALDSIDMLTGVSTPDDILALIFSSFCIGK